MVKEGLFIPYEKLIELNSQLRGEYPAVLDIELDRDFVPGDYMEKCETEKSREKPEQLAHVGGIIWPIAWETIFQSPETATGLVPYPGIKGQL